MPTTRALKIAVLPGDGVGPEVAREAVRVMRAAGDQYDIRVETSLGSQPWPPPRVSGPAAACSAPICPVR